MRAHHNVHLARGEVGEDAVRPRVDPSMALHPGFCLCQASTRTLSSSRPGLDHAPRAGFDPIHLVERVAALAYYCRICSTQQLSDPPSSDGRISVTQGVCFRPRPVAEPDELPRRSSRLLMVGSYAVGLSRGPMPQLPEEVVMGSVIGTDAHRGTLTCSDVDELGTELESFEAVNDSGGADPSREATAC